MESSSSLLEKGEVEVLAVSPNRLKPTAVANPSLSTCCPNPSRSQYSCFPLQLARDARRRASFTGPNLPMHQDFQSAERSVTPFLAKHQKRALRQQIDLTPPSASMASTYCNRHRPELKCARRADEATMEQLQDSLSQLNEDDQLGISHVWSVFSVAPSKQRQLILQGILTVCCFPQLSFVSAQVRDLIKIDFVSTLPNELAFKILSYLDTISLCKAAQVSRAWNVLAEDDVIWHQMCEQHIAKRCKKCGWGLPLLDRYRLDAEKNAITRRAHSLVSHTSADCHVASEAVSDCPMPASHKRPLEDASRPALKRACVSAKESTHRRPWKDIYKDRFKVGTNWKYGRYSLKVLEGHANGVMCLQLQDNILASASYDGTIKLWDLDTGKQLRTLTGHTSGIRCLQFSRCKLFSGGMDKTIRIWNWETGELVRTLTGPTGDVLTIDYQHPYLVAGGKDDQVRVWNFKTKTVSTLSGHKDFINSVRIHLPSRTIISAADDNLIMLWDLDTCQVLKTLEGHVGAVQQITLLPQEFELDDSDLLDCEHNSSGFEPEIGETLSPSHHSQICHDRLATPANVPSPSPTAEKHLTNASFFSDPSRPNPPLYVVSASLDSTIRLWHIPTARCLRTFFGHIEGIWAIAADNLRIASGSEDRTVKIWDPRSGKCERTFTGHSGPVTCVGLSGDRLITGSEDCKLRVMEFGPNQNSSPKS